MLQWASSSWYVSTAARLLDRFPFPFGKLIDVKFCMTTTLFIGLRRDYRMVVLWYHLIVAMRQNKKLSS